MAFINANLFDKTIRKHMFSVNQKNEEKICTYGVVVLLEQCFGASSSTNSRPRRRQRFQRQ